MSTEDRWKIDCVTMSEHVPRRPVSLSKRSLNMDHKIPYVDLIGDAILASPNRRLTASEIFEAVSAKYGPMKKPETLKNTIRHTLSRYDVFQKVQRGRLKKPSWWTIDEGVLLAAGQREHGQQIEWGSRSTIATGHAEAPPTHTLQLYGPPTYQPIGNPPVVFFGNGPLAQNLSYKPPLPFSEPSETGQAASSGCFINQPEMPGQSCAAAVTDPGLPNCQPPNDVSAPAGRCIVSVEDTAL